jgi:hypothetical protein
MRNVRIHLPQTLPTKYVHPSRKLKIPKLRHQTRGRLSPSIGSRNFFRQPPDSSFSLCTERCSESTTKGSRTACGSTSIHNELMHLEARKRSCAYRQERYQRAEEQRPTPRPRRLVIQAFSNLRTGYTSDVNGICRVEIGNPNGGEEEDWEPGDPCEELDEADRTDVRRQGAGGGDDGAKIGEEGAG